VIWHGDDGDRFAVTSEEKHIDEKLIGIVVVVVSPERQFVSTPSPSTLFELQE
jgi:hypothetical protein